MHHYTSGRLVERVESMENSVISKQLPTGAGIQAGFTRPWWTFNGAYNLK